MASLDAVQAGLHELDGGDLAGPDHLGLARDPGEHEVGGVHGGER